MSDVQVVLTLLLGAAYVIRWAIRMLRPLVLRITFSQTERPGEEDALAALLAQEPKDRPRVAPGGTL